MHCLIKYEYLYIHNKYIMFPKLLIDSELKGNDKNELDNWEILYNIQ